MGKLELRRERGTLRHVLDGRVVEIGSRLEVLLRGGTWIVGTYDWNGVEARWPGLRFELGGAWEAEPRSVPRPPSGVMALHPDAVLRWPTRAAASESATPEASSSTTTTDEQDASSTVIIRRSAIPRGT